ncbi:MAG: DinB family protein [Chitinophagaceae bacterium]
MSDTAIVRLEYLCDTIPQLLWEIDEKIFSLKTLPDKWSKKQIIGHLIDSATNNHQRFIRGQFEDIPTIAYDQNKWNEYSYYQVFDKEQIINFWTIYNKQLIELLRNIPVENLQKECIANEGKKYTLDFLITDYVEHLEHHLKQVVTYS